MLSQNVPTHKHENTISLYNILVLNLSNVHRTNSVYRLKYAPIKNAEIELINRYV